MGMLTLLSECEISYLNKSLIDIGNIRIQEICHLLLGLINKSMRNYTANDIEAHFKQYEKHVSHIIVAHTKHRPFIANMDTGRFKHVKAEQYAHTKMLETSKDLRYALNCFSKLLYPSTPNRPGQNPYVFKPLSFVTIEGANATTDRAQTIHVNIALGNLPAVLTTENIETLFRHAWHDMAKQGTDVKAFKFEQVEGKAHWFGYSLKEAQQNTRKAWDTNSIWDVSNCWIPHAALKAD